jgi:hypothetical protein
MFSRLFLISTLALSLSCASIRPTGDQFLNAVVDCSKVNPENSAAASAVLSCLQSAISGNPAACLLNLVTVGHWTVDEVACVVRALGESANVRALRGIATATDATVERAAHNWLTQQNIGFR